MEHINVISSFDTYYQPHGVIDTHNHTFFHYIYVYKGFGEIVTDNVKTELQKGYIYLIKPLSMHRFEAGERGMSTIEIKFETEDNSLFSKMCSLPARMYVKDTDAPRVLRKMVEETSRTDKYARKMESIKFLELALILQREKENLCTDSQSIDTANRFSAIIGYINQHLQEEISLKTLSQLAYMDSIYFLKQFKKHTGTTPMNYVKKMRIEKAKNLLLYSDMNITQAAIASGFSGIHHFCNAFKKETGKTPSGYKNNKEKN